MNPPTATTCSDQDHVGRLAAILSIQPDDATPLTQFSPEQRRAYEWAMAWLHDFNLGRMPKPDFSDEVLGRLSDYHETQMNEHFSRKEPAITPLPKPDDKQREGMSPDDPLAEWTQRILAGMKRMTEDPEFRASIEKRLS